MSREEGKEDRRRRVIDAAEALIRRSGDTDFSMTQLAQRAGLSIATPYNLIGTKSAILYALLNASADRMFDNKAPATVRETDPFQRVLRAADALTGTLIREPDFYRPLYAFLFGVVDKTYRPAFMARSNEYWREALDGLVERGAFPAGVTAPALARQFVILATGTVDLWVQRELTERQLVAQMRHGSCLVLLGMASGGERERLLCDLEGTARQLPRRQHRY